MPRLLIGIGLRQRFIGHDKRGSVGIMFALLLVPMILSLGLSLDYLRMTQTRARLNYIADSVTLAAVGKSSIGYSEALQMVSDGPISDANAEAATLFNAEAATTPGLKITSLSTSVLKSNGTITATATYTASVNMSFMRIVGITSLPVSGTSAASNGLITYIDFYMMLDNSPSMGLAATNSDITALQQLTGGCAFGCHDLSNSNNNYNIAQRNNITLRIDVLRSATQALTTTATNAEQVQNQFRMAVYTFNNDITTIAPLTSNLNMVSSEAQAIDLTQVPYQGYNNDQYTDLVQSLSSMNAIIPSPGSGYSASTPQKVLFLVTDGVGDYAGVNGRTIETVQVPDCTAIKKRGIKIAVLYTTYLPLPTNAFYNQYVAPFQSSINPTMQSCASPGLFFEVSPSQGISQAMQALFLEAVSQAHLTQ